MKLPTFFHSRAVVALIVVVSLAAVAISIAWNWNASGPRPGTNTGAIFFDEATQQFTRLPSETIPPVAGKNGDSLVRAVVRGRELVPENIVYLFRFTPETKARWESEAKDESAVRRFTALMIDEVEGKEVRLPQAGSKWVPAKSPEGQKILAGG